MLNWDHYKTISNKVGKSFYIAKPKTFRENYDNLLSAFKANYENTNIAYSYKTNYLPQFCSIVHDMKGYAEVVSSMELQLALSIGVPHNRIFFNGPFKETNMMFELLSNGGVVNVDSIEELTRVKVIANELNTCTRVGVRCNFDIDDGVQSRFGVADTIENIQRVIETVSNHTNMKLVGLHCHFASRTLKSWRNRTIAMTQLLSQMSLKQLSDLKYVSLGGGLYGEMAEALKCQFEDPIPSFTQYAEASALEFSRTMSVLGRRDIELIIEPGTALAASAMEFICSVQSVKQLGTSTFVTVDGSSFNLGTFKSKINPPLRVLHDAEARGRVRVTKAKIVGYTCIEQDFLHEDFSEDIAIGDAVLFEEIGSYSIVMKPPFILPNVAIVDVCSKSGDFKILKKREKFEDVFRTYEY